MEKKEVSLIIVAILITVYLLAIITCQQQNQNIPKDSINIRNIRRNRKNLRNKIISGNRAGNGVNNGNNKISNGKGKNNKKKTKGKNNRNNNNNNGNVGNGNNDSGFLMVEKNYLTYKRKKVFVSGVNLSYKNMGRDFGVGEYNLVKSQYEAWMKQISDAGGNAMRFMLHGDASSTPKVDNQGFSTGEETAVMIQELSQLLDTAASYNIFVFIVLWSGALSWKPDALTIFTNEVKLDRYIEKVLKPVVSGLKTKKALAAWEIMTSPQGSVRNNIVDSNPCFDTQNLFHQFASFSSNNQTMKDMLRFLNKQLDAIRIADPKVLRSLISKEEEAIDMCDWCYNYWQDKCLIAGGGKSNGVLDFYQFDAVAFTGTDYYWSPVRKNANDYKLNKPIMIGMTSGNCSQYMAVDNYKHALNTGYAGVFGWRYSPGIRPTCADTPVVLDNAMMALKNSDMVRTTIN